MRVLYVCGTYLPAWSGAEASARTSIRGLQSRGIECAVATMRSNSFRRSGDGVTMWWLNPSRVEADLLAVVDKWRPTVILTQLLWSDCALTVAQRCGVPSVLRVCSLPIADDLRDGTWSPPTEVVAISGAVAAEVRLRWNRECHIVPPAIDSAVVTSGPQRRRYITMFNPVASKGGYIFRDVATLMPDRAFAVVPGWHCLRAQDGSFDEAIVKALCKSIGVAPGMPDESDFTDLPNVVVLPPRDDVAGLYAQTHTLCVPSISPEAFGRVAMEGFLNRIPVIGSAVGGLGVQVSIGGIGIDQYNDPLAWVAAIRRLEDPAEYERVAEAGWRYAQSACDLESSITALVAALESAAVRTCM